MVWKWYVSVTEMVPKQYSGGTNGTQIMRNWYADDTNGHKIVRKWYEKGRPIVTKEAPIKAHTKGTPSDTLLTPKAFVPALHRGRIRPHRGSPRIHKGEPSAEKQGNRTVPKS